MRILRKLFQIVYSIGFVLILISISYIFASNTYYNHNVGSKGQVIERNVENDKIKGFFAENRDYIMVEIECFEKQKAEYLINLALDYFYKYNKEIYLYDFTYPESLVVINCSGKANIHTLK